MSGARPELAVVVPTRDRPAALAACLSAVQAQDGPPPFEVVVVDDASTDPGAVAAVAAAAGARVVRGAGRGPAAARNLGASATDAPLVGFTDDDCRPGPAWVAALVRRFVDGVDAVAGPTRNGRPEDPFAAASQALTNHVTEWSHDPVAGTVGFAPTSNLAVRRELLDRLPFDESFPLAAGEDRDWCTRLGAAGIPLTWEPAAWVAHHQDLTLRRFWRQQLRYGRGARQLPGTALHPPAFYVQMLGRGLREGPVVAGLVVLAQVAVAVGRTRG
jgi:cellulose synthase/poly-beta-1,6-N-acetylglucosamine synthase-like glycosyltransferase